MRVILLNGRDVTSSDVANFMDGRFFQGVRAMTTMLFSGSFIVDFSRHMERLYAHANDLLLMDLPSQQFIEFEVQSAIQRSGARGQLRIRIILFLSDSGSTGRIIDISRLEGDQFPSNANESGLRLCSYTDKAWPRGAHIKSGALGPHREIALNQAKKGGFDDVLWVNGDGEVAEATWANIFLIGRTGDLVEIATPALASGLLAGIVRRRIAELLNTAKIPVTERVVTIDELPRFDEAFVTSSIRGLVPVLQIDRHRLQTLRPNAVFHHIARLYQTWLSTQNSNDFGDLIKNHGKLDA